MNQVIFAFVAGVSFGALVACALICAAIVASGRGGRAEKEGRTPSVGRADSSPCTSRGALEGETEKMKRQFENFLNYDGTTNGQLEIGDE